MSNKVFVVHGHDAADERTRSQVTGQSRCAAGSDYFRFAGRLAADSRKLARRVRYTRAESAVSPAGSLVELEDEAVHAAGGPGKASENRGGNVAVDVVRIVTIREIEREETYP